MNITRCRGLSKLSLIVEDFSHINVRDNDNYGRSLIAEIMLMTMVGTKEKKNASKKHKPHQRHHSKLVGTFTGLGPSAKMQSI